jgi:hypothetical protein
MILGVAIATGLFCSARAGHRRPPEPRGMVFRAEVRKVESPMDRFDVRAIELGGRAIAIWARASGQIPARLVIHRYPDGDLLEVLVGTDAERAWRELPRVPDVGGAIEAFDFDGDGTADELESEPVMQDRDYGVVRIRSGRDRRLLFLDEDELEYETWDRAVPLGDLDGDGCSELALLHPRMDRSGYDLELWDWLLGAKSWVTIVSGGRATR